MPDTEFQNGSREKWLEAGRLLFATGCEFVTGATNQASLPAPDGMEVAFIGRSNVGKSSLINALCGRKALARVSNTPGRTQQINFFALSADLTIVDMPGYGYARAARNRIEAWNRLIRSYLRERATLARVFVLLDARHEIKPADREIMALLDGAAVSFQAVLTKADKIKPAALEAVVATAKTVLAKHPAAHPDLQVTSAVDNRGIAELRADIAALAAR